MSTKKSWEKFLNPESLRLGIENIAFFICVFEMFKDAVIDKPKTMYADVNSISFVNGRLDFGLSDVYKTNVKDKSNNIAEASLLWLMGAGAISNADIEKYHQIRRYRNKVIHEMAYVLTSSDEDFRSDLFEDLINLYVKIEKWWFFNFEVEIDPAIFPEDIDPEEVIPGSILLVQLMSEILTNPEPENAFYYNAFKNLWTESE